jgi:hypothetical protein
MIKKHLLETDRNEMNNDRKIRMQDYCHMEWVKKAERSSETSTYFYQNTRDPTKLYPSQTEPR